MAERVAFSKSINLAWLNEVAGYSIAGLSRKEAGDKLNITIGQSISNQVNIKQARIILLNTWYDSDPIIRENAVRLFNEVGTEERLALHWALLLTQYALFYDLSNILGHMYVYRDSVTTQQIRERIYEKWGERSTVANSLTKNMKSFKDIGAIMVPGKAGVYFKTVHSITETHTTGTLLTAILRASNQKYITWDAFCNHAVLFPFCVKNVTEADMASLKIIALDRVDGKTVLSIAE